LLQVPRTADLIDMRDHDVLFFAGTGPAWALSLPALLLFGAFEPRSKILSRPEEAGCRSGKIPR
ncbi:MAG TPA: hypothetical protein VEI04_00345, partial [Syntrophobacteria bacterium]|nr:hypothetical protein [Syntrophobacteria bacterium]